MPKLTYGNFPPDLPLQLYPLIYWLSFCCYTIVSQGESLSLGAPFFKAYTRGGKRGSNHSNSYILWAEHFFMYGREERPTKRQIACNRQVSKETRRCKEFSFLRFALYLRSVCFKLHYSMFFWYRSMKCTFLHAFCLFRCKVSLRVAPNKQHFRICFISHCSASSHQNSKRKLKSVKISTIWNSTHKKANFMQFALSLDTPRLRKSILPAWHGCLISSNPSYHVGCVCLIILSVQSVYIYQTNDNAFELIKPK